MSLLFPLPISQAPVDLRTAFFSFHPFSNHPAVVRQPPRLPSPSIPSVPLHIPKDIPPPAPLYALPASSDVWSPTNGTPNQGVHSPSREWDPIPSKLGEMCSFDIKI